MPRVEELAKELDMSADDVRSRLSAMGEDVDGNAEVGDDIAQRLRAEIGGQEGAPVPSEPATTEMPEGSVAADAPADPDATRATPAVASPSDPEAAPTVASPADPEATQAVAPPSDPEATQAVAPPSDPEATQAVAPPQPPATTKVDKKRPLRRVLKVIAELPILVIVAFLIAVLIKTFLVQAFYIPSGSMIPTLRVGDRVLVEKISYFVGDPGRGDVVVFARSVFGQKRPDVPWYKDARNYLRELLGLPTGQEEDYIKRIVAVGGDTIRYEGKPRQLYVNGEEIEEDYINNGRDTGSDTLTSSDCRGLKMKPGGGGCRVPAGKVFVMGDNRTNSQDSRVIGPVDDDKIVGRAFLIVWPPKDFGTI